MITKLRSAVAIAASWSAKRKIPYAVCRDGATYTVAALTVETELRTDIVLVIDVTRGPAYTDADLPAIKAR